MEAGLVAFQNEENQYKFVIERKQGKIYIVESTPFKTATTVWTDNELPQYNPDNFIYLKIKIEGKQFECFYSLNNKDWTSAGVKQDATKLTTQVAGGFVGAYIGLYLFAKSPAKATFDWVNYQKTN